MLDNRTGGRSLVNAGISAAGGLISPVSLAHLPFSGDTEAMEAEALFKEALAVLELKGLHQTATGSSVVGCCARPL